MTPSLDTVTITSPDGDTVAEFVPGANLLGCSLRHRGAELLHRGQGVEAYATLGETMGIPLLYPWANRLSRRGYAAAGQTVSLPDPEGRYALDPGGLPIHGALPGDLHWDVEVPAPERLHGVLEWSGDALRELFPFSHRVEVEAVVSATALSIATATPPNPAPTMRIRGRVAVEV